MKNCMVCVKNMKTDLAEGKFLRCFQSSIIFSNSICCCLGSLVPLFVAFYRSVSLAYERKDSGNEWPCRHTYCNAISRDELDFGRWDRIVDKRFLCDVHDFQRKTPLCAMSKTCKERTHLFHREKDSFVSIVTEPVRGSTAA